MKKIYLIRHAESEGNVGFAWQGKNGGLTDRGRAQAQLAARRLAGIPLASIISSPMQRAKETAEIISAHLDKGVEYSDLFVERRRPTTQIGMSRNDPASLSVEQEINAHFGEPGWHYADEENFEDMKTRGEAALAYLTARPETEIAIITHGYFMRVILACALAGAELTPEMCAHFITSFHTENTGITQLVYDESQSMRPWWLWLWNDHSHLAIDEFDTSNG